MQAIGELRLLRHGHCGGGGCGVSGGGGGGRWGERACGEFVSGSANPHFDLAIFVSSNQYTLIKPFRSLVIN